MNITFQGNPVTLKGKEVAVGSVAPEFTLRATDLSDVTLDKTSGKRVFVVVPSLDTPVCDIEAKRFNEEASKLDGVSVYVISMDLPFAQARWCGAVDAKNVTLLSAYNSTSFGENYGVYIEGIGLLTRAIFVIDENNKVIYTEYCSEITNEPNYDEALKALK